MPMYNAESTVMKAISSVQWQTCRDWELIIVDDGSSDRGFEIASSVRDPRIRLIRNQSNQGISMRLNQAFQAAKGEFIARMDSDDVAFPERLERQRALLRSKENIDLVGAWYATFNNEGRLGGVIEVPPTHREITAQPWKGIYVAHPTWMARRAFFERFVYNSEMDGAEDQDVLLRAHCTTQFTNLPEVLLAYRQPPLEWKKVRRARSVFLRAALHYGFKSKSAQFLTMMILTHCIKFVSDVLSLKLRLHQFARQSAPVPSVLSQQWYSLWRQLENTEKEAKVE